VTENEAGPASRDHQEVIVETVYRVLAGIDVHKKMLAVVVRRDTGEQTVYEQRQFGSTRREIEHLAAYLQQQRVTEAVMESTAQYWRPVWHGLEAHFGLHLCHPLKTKGRRGRKSDFRDARRLVDRLHSGDLEDSFVPGAEQREWRLLTRMRVDLKDKISVVRSQVEGLLELGGIKLSAVLSDTFGVSGWAMLKRISQGDYDLDGLLGEMRGLLRRKRAEVTEALAGRLSGASQLLLQQYLQQVELLREQIAQIDAAVGLAMKAYAPTLNRLCHMPGIDLAAAQGLLAEIGPTAAAFASAEQLASWAGVCPGMQESAGVNYSARSPKGNRYIRRLLCQIAWAAVRTKDTFFASLFARLKPRVEAKGAAWAVAHRISKVVWLMLHQGVEYQEKGPAAQNPKTLARKFRRLLKDFQRLGIDPQSLILEGTARA
jgi:transposase